MLFWEFYALNATATLLWLCQRFEHTVLLGLIALGAVCVLVCLFVLASSSIRFSVRIVRTSFSTIIDICFPGDVLPPECSWSPSYVLRPRQGLCDHSDIIRDAALAHLAPSDDSSLSLPQSLALNPDQWHELPARSSSRVNENVPPLHPVETSDKRSTLRRSRRQQRAHVTNSS